MRKRVLAVPRFFLLSLGLAVALLAGQAPLGLAQTASPLPLNAAAGPDVDLLPWVGLDGGFESASPFASWHLKVQGASTIVKDGGQKVAGAASAKLTAAGTPAEMACYLPAGFPVQGGKYRLSFWARTSNTPLQYLVYLSINGADYSLDLDDAAKPWKNDILWNDDVPTTSGWTRRSVEFAMPVQAGATMEMIISFKTDNSGTAWLDGFRIDPVWTNHTSSTGAIVPNVWRFPAPFSANLDTVYINGQPGNRMSLVGNLARDGDFIRDGALLYFRDSVNPASDVRKLQLGVAPATTPTQPAAPTQPATSYAVASGTDLAAKIASLGSTTGTVVVKTAITLAGAVTIPANVTLQVDSGGSINRNGKSLTIKGPIKAGAYQIFTGSGTLVGAPKDTGVLPQWFGAKGNGSFNDTTAIQAGLNFAAGGKFLVPATASEYRIYPIFVRSNTTVEFASGAKMRALSGYGTYDRMFCIQGVSNVKVIGNNVMLRMNRSDYTTGEQRHIVDIRGSTNVEVTGVNAYDSGGDGFYVGAAVDNDAIPSRNITLRNCVADNNRRQGMSIVCADGVYVYDSIFRNTKGTDPQSGLDIEPDSNQQIIKNIVFTRCQFYGNTTANGILIYLNSFTASNTVSIKFDSCKSYNNLFGFHVHYKYASLRSGITTVNCDFSGNSYMNIHYQQN